MITALELATRVSSRLGMGGVTTLFGTSNETTMQLLEMIRQAALYCFNNSIYTEHIKNYTHTTVAAEDQGALSSLISDFDYFIGEADKFQTPGIKKEWNWQVHGGHLYIKPAPAAGETVVLTYKRGTWVRDADNASTYKTDIEKNGDLILIDTELLILATKVEWKDEMGMSSAIDIAKRNMRLAQVQMRDGIQPVKNLTPRSATAYPSAVVNLYGTIAS